MLVELHRSTDYASIILKAAMPVRVTEHQIRRAVRATLVRTAVEPAKIRPNTQHIEIVAGRRVAAGDSWILARVQADKSEIEGRQIFEAVVAITKIAIVEIRLKTRILPVHSTPKTLGLRHVQRAQHQTIHYAEHHGVRA